MATVIVNDSNLYDIADSIRAKLGVQTTYKPSEMADAIDSISGGSSTLGTKTITTNGTYDAEDDDLDGYSEVTVNVSGITPTGTKSITANGIYDVTQYASAEVDVPAGSSPVINSLSVAENGTYTAPTGVDGYSPITVNVPQGITPTGTKQISITQNGTIIEDVTNYANAEINASVSGGSTWTEYTATSGASNAQTCANLLFPSQTSGKHYFAYLIDKDVSNFVNNQFVMLSWYRNGNSMLGGGTRYRSGAYGNLQGVSNSYDAVIETGDKFMVCEM